MVSSEFMGVDVSRYASGHYIIRRKHGERTCGPAFVWEGEREPFFHS